MVLVREITTTVENSFTCSGVRDLPRAFSGYRRGRLRSAVSSPHFNEVLCDGANHTAGWSALLMLNAGAFYANLSVCSCTFQMADSPD